jgi:hypothetical protein
MSKPQWVKPAEAEVLQQDQPLSRADIPVPASLYLLSVDNNCQVQMRKRIQ